MGTAQEKPAEMNVKRPPQWEAVFYCSVWGGAIACGQAPTFWIALFQLECGQPVGARLLVMAVVQANAQSENQKPLIGTPPA
jgi:hypothetical protein